MFPRAFEYVAPDTLDEVLALVAERCGPEAEVLIVPHALLTLPVVTPGLVGVESGG